MSIDINFFNIKEIKTNIKNINNNIIKNIFSKLYVERNHNLNNTIIVAGTGRSGTTWLAQILEKYLRYRFIFEPFHPLQVKEFNKHEYKKYLRPEDNNPELHSVINKILTGRIRNKWMDHLNRSFMPKGRIVKTIRANYFLKWIKNNFPEVPIIYILRHPCAVVNSWVKLGWGTVDWKSLLSQELLLFDFFEPYLNVFNKADTSIKKIACIWCAEQLVPLNTMYYKDWIVITYEDLCQNAKNEIENIFKYIKVDKKINILNAKRIIPTTVRQESAILKKKDPLKAWQWELSRNEIEQILEIVENFSLDIIYDSSIIPYKNNLEKILKYGLKSCN